MREVRCLNRNNLYGEKNITLNILWKFLERGSSLAVSLIVTIVLSRILDPEDYGVVAIVTVFVNLSQIFVTAGLGNALIQKKDADEKDFSTMLWINILISSFLYLILFLLAPIIASFYMYDDLSPLLRTLSLVLIIMSLNSIQVAYISKKMLFKNYFFSTLSSKIISGLIGIIMALTGFGAWALVGQTLSQRIIETAVLWFRVPWKPQKIFSIKKAKPLYSFAWKIMLMTFIESIRDQMRSLIIGKTCSSQDLAFYDKGALLPNTFITNSLSSLSEVMFPVMSNYQNENEKQLMAMRRWLSLLAYCSFPLLVILACVGEPLFLLVFTEKWLPAVPFLRVCCFTYAVWVFEVPIRETLKSKGYADVCLKMQIIKSIISITIIVLVMKNGIMAIAYSGIFCGIINIGISVYYGKKILGYKYTMVCKDVYQTLMFCVVITFLIYSVSSLKLPLIVALLIQLIVGIVAYIIVSYVIKNENFFYVIDLIRRLKS